MNILHICNAFQTNPLYEDLFRCLNNYNIQQSVIAPGATEGITNKNSIKILNIKRSNNVISRLFWGFRIIRIYKVTKHFFDCTKFDLIHAHTLFSDGAIAYLLNLKYKTQYCVAVRSTDLNVFFKIPFLKRIGYLILKHSSAIYLISEANRKLFITFLPENIKSAILKKTYLIPNGINRFWLQNIVTNIRDLGGQQSIRMIYAGDICYNKNIHNILKLFSITTTFGIESFTAVGYKESDTSEYANNIFTQEQKISGFKLLPKCKKEELIQLYRNSDIYIQPSFTETFGLSYIEALTQGLPVIYSKGQGIDGMFEDGLVGYSVNPNDVVDIASKIELICARYQEIKSNISNIDFSKFSWENIAREYYMHYKKIANLNL